MARPLPPETIAEFLPGEEVLVHALVRQQTGDVVNLVFDDYRGLAQSMWLSTRLVVQACVAPAALLALNDKVEDGGNSTPLVKTSP